MGFFNQEIKLGISNNDYVIEKVELPKIKKGTVYCTVAPGTIAYVNGVKLKGQAQPYELSGDQIAAKGTSISAYLWPNKMFDSVPVPFFGGRHEVSLNAYNLVRATFAIVGTANVEIDDYLELAKHYDRSVTKDEVRDDIINNYRSILSDEVSAAAVRYIKNNASEVDLMGAFGNIINDVIASGRKTTNALYNMGLMLTRNGITLHLNPVDGAEDIINELNGKLKDRAFTLLGKDEMDMNNENKDRETERRVKEIVAGNTNRQETDTTIKKTINGSEQAPVQKSTKKLFCEGCGQEITSPTAKFCPNCGHRINGR